MSFAERITKEEYERQSRDYTKQMLDELAHMVRREPQLTKKTVRFERTYAQFRSKELLLRTALLLLVGGPLWFAYTECELPTPVSLDELRSRALCKMGIEMTSIPPFLLMMVGGVTFCLWILSMFLQSKQIQQTVTLPQQVALAVIRTLLLPLFLSITIILGLFFIVTFKYQTPSQCVRETTSLSRWMFPEPELSTTEATTTTSSTTTAANEDPTRVALTALFTAAAKFGHCFASLVEMDEHSSLFIALTACVFVAMKVLGTVLTVARLHNAMTAALWLVAAVAINLLGSDSSSRKGEQFIMVMWLSSVLLTAGELIKLLVTAAKKKRTIQTESNKPEDEDEISEEDDEETENDVVEQQKIPSQQ